MTSRRACRVQISAAYVRPLLLVDVDGVISLFGFDPASPPAGTWQVVDGIPHLLSAQAGGHLRRLADDFELVWCTGWEEKAEEYLPRVLEIAPGAAHLGFDRTRSTAAHWKLAAIDAHAGPTRPLAWVDDALDEACRRWAAERPGPTLLVGTDPAVGISDTHVAELLDWAATLKAAPYAGRR